MFREFLKTLIVKNFQSHKDTTLEFDPGINVIIGRGQSGKTAILRALLWLIYYRPAGFRFHTHGEKTPTEVGLVIQNGEEDRTISLLKDKNKAKYMVSGFSDPFSGFGTTVPPEVVEAINLSEVNIHQQLDRPFLITDTPGEVGRVISRITKLEEVDGWISALTTKINTNNTTVSTLQVDLNELEEEQAEYNFIPDLEEEVSKLEVMEDELLEIENEIETITNLVVELREVMERKSKLDYSPEAELLLEEIIKDMAEKEDVEEQMYALMSVVEDLQDVGERKEKLDYSPEVEVLLDELIKDMAEKEEAEEQMYDLMGVVERHTEIVGVKADCENEVMKLEDEYYQLLLKMKKCPFCHSTLTTDKINVLYKGI